jgi:protein arginine kinase activator
MVCDFCENKATVFLTQLVDGKMTKVCLCENCAKERGVTDPTGFSLADIVLGGAAAAKSKETSPSPRGSRTCPACGFTLEDLKRARRFGCAECYTVFREELNALLRGMHAGHMHTGKVPVALMERHETERRLAELRERLDQAISAEHYEEAAGLRDEIRLLEIHNSQPS